MALVFIFVFFTVGKAVSACINTYKTEIYGKRWCTGTAVPF